MQNEKHQLLLHLNDASHIIGNCNKEFYNFREQPEIAEVIGKSANNRFSLDNPEYIYREVNYGEKKTISIINEMQSMIGGGSITDYLREPNYFFL